MPSVQDQAYEYYMRSIDNPPYKWDDGSTVAAEDHALYFLMLLFEDFAVRGRLDFLPLSGRDSGKPIDELVVESLTGPSKEYRDRVERMARDVPKIGVLAGETLKPNLWPVVLKGLPNPSGIAWAYSSKRNDYAGAMHTPEEPKRFMKRGRVAGTLVCG